MAQSNQSASRSAARSDSSSLASSSLSSSSSISRRGVGGPAPSRRRATGAPGSSSPRCGKATYDHDRAGEQQDQDHDDDDSEHERTSREMRTLRRLPASSTVPHRRRRCRIRRAAAGSTAARITSGIGVTGRAGSVLSTYTCTNRPSAAASSPVALEQADPVDDRRRADLVDDHADVDRLRVADLAEVAAADLGDDADRGQRPDVDAGRLGEVGVDDGVDELEVAGVVHVPVDVDVAPSGW